MAELSERSFKILKEFVNGRRDCIGHAFLNREDRDYFEQIKEELLSKGLIEERDGLLKVAEAGYQLIESIEED